MDMLDQARMIIIFTGFFVVAFSGFALSFLLQPDRKEIEDYLNRKVDKAIYHIAILSLSLILIWVTGVWKLARPNYVNTILLDIAAIVMGTILIYVNISMIYMLIKIGYRPVFNRIIIDIGASLAVIWLVFEKFSLSWYVVVLISAVCVGIILYFLFWLLKYRQIVNIIVEPISIYRSGVGFRIFSILYGMSLISSGYSEEAYKGYIVLSFTVFAAVFWFTSRELRKLLKL
jgi:hypothetical protein